MIVYYFILFFSNILRGVNKMIDTFKDYAKDVSYKAILAVIGMVIMSCLIASYLVNKNTNTNIIVYFIFIFVTIFIIQLILLSNNIIPLLNVGFI